MLVKLASAVDRKIVIWRCERQARKSEKVGLDVSDLRRSIAQLKTNL